MKKILSVLLVLATVLTLFTACGEKAPKEMTEGDFSYIALEDNTAKITKFNKTEDIINLEIPATLGDMTVTVIGTEAFAGAQNITVVYAPETLLEIEDRAFAGSSVRKMFTHYARNLKTIGSQAFAECHELIQVDISDGVETIKANAFYYCDSLRVVTFRGNPATIENLAFDACQEARFYVSNDAKTAIDYARSKGIEVFSN
ncbi:MAG: leucine-rich repeat domain-containing protein [Clostridia bacterium]|nr:leucine-rich repeat domain-containing protein [Clostridia bacterium]